MRRSGDFAARPADGIRELAFETGTRRIRNFEKCLRSGAALALVLTIGSYFGAQYWVLELLTHFRVQFLAGALLLLVIAALMKRRGICMMAIVVAGANLLPLLPLTVPGATTTPAAGASPVRLMSANVWFKNRDYEAALDLIIEEDPDIVGLLEVDNAWISRLAALQTIYPYSILLPEDGAHGMALFSRFPLRDLEPNPYVAEGMQTGIFVEVQLVGQTFDLLLTHLIAPTTADRARLRNRQLARIPEMLRAHGVHGRLLAGDLNITPWSPYYALLEKQTGMTNAAQVAGYRPTWPTGFNPLKIPIDHVLLSNEFAVSSFRTGADIGSDHLPIIVDLVVADSPKVL